MPRTQTPDLRDYRRGAEAMRALIVEALDRQIVTLKYAGSPQADMLIRWKITKLPSVADLLASELNAAPGKLVAGLEPKPPSIDPDEVPF